MNSSIKIATYVGTVRSNDVTDIKTTASGIAGVILESLLSIMDLCLKTHI